MDGQDHVWQINSALKNLQKNAHFALVCFLNFANRQREQLSDERKETSLSGGQVNIRWKPELQNFNSCTRRKH